MNIGSNHKTLVFLLLIIFTVSSLIYGEERFQYTHAIVTTHQGARIDVEVADTEKKRQRGFSFRKEILPDKGMLFVFDERKTHAFWMKDMLIPIDIIWMNNHRIVHIEHNVQPLQKNENPKTITPPKIANFVLELAAGQAQKLNLQVGKKLKYQF